MIRYLQNVGTLISQAAHTLIVSPKHPANPDITISARAHIESEYYGNPRWTIARDVIDWLFFWDANHCRGSFVRDLRNAAMFEEYAFQLEQRNETN